MKIITTTDLNETQKQCAFDIWNAEYPARLQMAAISDMDDFLNPLADKKHYLLAINDNNIVGWAATFSVENERRFFVMVTCAYHGKGCGTFLINELKKNENQLSGWMIDHNNDTKINGKPYLSPLNFYIKNLFMVNPALRLENEKISAVNIVWEADKNQR